MPSRSPLPILTSSNSYATAVFFAAAQALDYDLEALAMDAEALLLEMRKICGNEMPPANQQKLLAACSIYFTDKLYEDLPGFINAANLFANRVPPPITVFDPADTLECCWFKFELELIDGGRDEEEFVSEGRNPYLEESREPARKRFGFCEEIRAYVGAVASTEGALRPLPQFPEMILPSTELYDPAAAEFAMIDERHRELVDDITDAIVDNASLLFSQLQRITSSSGHPIMSANEAAQTIEGIRKAWAVRKDYFEA